MQFSACITTRNRIEPLKACLSALWNSEVKPFSIIVSDDSADLAIQQANQQVAQQYSETTYVIGPQRGVCANRNHALNIALTSPTDLIAFIDDDICVEPMFIANTLNRYQQMPFFPVHAILNLKKIMCVANFRSGVISALVMCLKLSISMRQYFRALC
jgi:glycosyltransferase involved in cell wall biosynthesis